MPPVSRSVSIVELQPEVVVEGEIDCKEVRRTIASRLPTRAGREHSEAVRTGASQRLTVC